jgi:hypothetical protein
MDDRAVIRDEIQNCQVQPPLSAMHPNASMLVTSLLKRDFRRRLGTLCGSDVKRAANFRAVDWRAMEKGQTKPAFVCGPAPIDPEERQESLEAYTNKSLIVIRPKNRYRRQQLEVMEDVKGSSR